MRFELSGTAEGKLLRSSAKTSSRLHTPQDIAGWHGLPGNIIAILDGYAVKPGPSENWDEFYQYYKNEFETLAEE